MPLTSLLLFQYMYGPPRTASLVSKSTVLCYVILASAIRSEAEPFPPSFSELPKEA
jgi:hypothetical protein